MVRLLCWPEDTGLWLALVQLIGFSYCSLGNCKIKLVFLGKIRSNESICVSSIYLRSYLPYLSIFYQSVCLSVYLRIISHLSTHRLPSFSPSFLLPSFLFIFTHIQARRDRHLHSEGSLQRMNT